MLLLNSLSPNIWELAVPLTRGYGIAYPTDLEQVMYDRLEKLLDTV